ncbi:MAG TPA: histidine kinase sensor domain-containing protein [Rheinheimera sp.]|nr:histidine kinase sensor domain-containing protein [Rheinheimera sp.]
MNRPLFIRLCLLLAVGTVLLFWLIAAALNQLEQQLSMLSPAARQTLLQYRDHAEALYDPARPAALQQWLNQIRQQEQSWATVVRLDVASFDHTDLRARFTDGFILGRSIDWPIHLHLDYNPVMDLPFINQPASLLLELPERLRPGKYWPPLKLLLQLLLPLTLMLLVCYLLYRHLMRPVKLLQQHARQLAAGRLDSRVRPALGPRQDELTELADNFDLMAERLSQQLQRQRQFIADMSHELRTPLSRMTLALDCAEQQLDSQTMLVRLRRESDAMQQLIGNALTLAWLDNEAGQLAAEPFDLADLLDSVCSDARFEFPDRQLHCQWPDSIALQSGSARLLGQAIENILRNALRFTPPDGCVWLSVSRAGSHWQLQIRDSGPGVADAYLPRLFTPFFRVPGAEQPGSGYGLGLALAKRLTEAAGGSISAANSTPGLCITLMLPG